MQEKFYFEWSDAWILTGMMSYVKSEQELSNKVSLTEIIAVADWINHAILTHKELDNGIFRLMGAGYAVRSDNELSLTVLALPLYVKYYNSKRGILEKVNQTLKDLNSKSSKFNYTRGLIEQVISARDYQQALNTYKGMR